MSKQTVRYTDNKPARVLVGGKAGYVDVVRTHAEIEYFKYERYHAATVYGLSADGIKFVIDVATGTKRAVTLWAQEQ